MKDENCTRMNFVILLRLSAASECPSLTRGLTKTGKRQLGAQIGGGRVVGVPPENFCQ
jgi:hypothetical protein